MSGYDTLGAAVCAGGAALKFVSEPETFPIFHLWLLSQGIPSILTREDCAEMVSVLSLINEAIPS